MCGRYEIVDGKQIFVRFGVANTAPEMLANLDVRPTQQVPVLLTDHQLQLMKWGLVPSWCTANGVSISSNPNPDEIVMQSGSTVRAQASDLGSVGTSFSVAWKHS